MENLYLVDNINALMDTDGPPCITPQQISTFFGGEYSKANIKVAIVDMNHNSELTFNPVVEGYQRRFTDVKKSDHLKKWIDAFWPIAYMGSENVEYVVRSYPPAKYFVYTKDGKCLDFTIVDSKAVAVFGKEQRELHLIEGEEDIVNHVAILYNRKMMDVAKKYGYNVFALLNQETNKIEYL